MNWLQLWDRDVGDDFGDVSYDSNVVSILCVDIKSNDLIKTFNVRVKVTVTNLRQVQV